jgi:putative tricarboxylic transport membrane protein
MEKYRIFPTMFWVGVSLFLVIMSPRLGLGNLRSPGPGLMPFLIGACLFVISFCLFIRLVFRLGHREERVEEEGRVTLRKIVLVLGSLFVYALFLEKIGYPITTCLLLILLFRTMDMKWMWSLCGAGLTVFITYFVFTSLGVRFPMGILEWLGFYG